MYKLISIATLFCCDGGSRFNEQDNLLEDNSSRQTIIQPEDFQITALKYHIEERYQKSSLKLFKIKDNASQDDMTDVDTTISNKANISVDCTSKFKNFNNKYLDPVALLSFDNIAQLDYDSEKECFENIAQKLARIKGHFNQLSKHN